MRSIASSSVPVLVAGLLAFPLLASCTGKDDPLDGDSGEDLVSCADGELVRFVDTQGQVSDLTAEFAAGVEGAPAELVMDEDGVLEICGGTWMVMLEVTASDLEIRGDDSVSAPVLSGGGEGPIIELLTPDTRLVVEDMAFTDALACYGSVITAADMATECDREAGPLGADITLRRSHLHGNAFDIGGGVLGVAGGSVQLEDTLINNNEGHAVFAIGADVSCVGTPELDVGMHDNSKSGVWLSAPGETSGYRVSSENCDWGNNGQEDVRLGEDSYFNDFGADATFTCDARAETCE